MNEVDNELDERINNLEEKVDRLLNDFNYRMKSLDEDKAKLDDIDVDIKEFPEKINEAKREIVTFTFQLISTIIGFLSLTLAIVILWINQTGIDTQMEYILVALGIVFVVCFLIFVYSFRKKNFPKVEGDSYRNIISYIDSKNSDMVDYIDSKISDAGDVINSKNSDMSEYTDEKISEVTKLIKGGKK